MKKIVFALVVLMLTAPAWARVDIICAQIEANEPNVLVSYVNSEAQNVRGFALNIVVDAGNILEVECLSPDFGYYIYPGSINPEGGQEPTEGNWGTCVGDAGVYDDTLPGPNDSNGVTVEMASLYSPNDPDHNSEPCDVGDLVRIKVEENCCLTIVKNVIRAGVVMEDATSVDPNALGCCVTGIDCYTDAGTLQNWKDVGKPGSWCCAYQHLGDCTGDGWINAIDLFTKFKPAYNTVHPAAGYDPDADCNHDKSVNAIDLFTAFKPNYNTNPAGGAYDCPYD
jgi:hypothetical protein